MNGSGKGDNRGRRRSGKHQRDKAEPWKSKGEPWNPPKVDPQFGRGAPNQGRLEGKKKNDRSRNSPRYDKNDGALYEKPRWTPPKYNTEPLPVPDCPYCGKPIKDIQSALSDKSSGTPVHFDCVIAKLSETETLEQGDTISYIGGGRFGVVHFNGPGGSGGHESTGKNFTIKKIFEWESTEHRADWRGNIADHFSIT
jgi:hypothetical protein